MKRGDLVTVALAGDFGKPRPAVVIQSDLLNRTHKTVVVCLLTSRDIGDNLLRIAVDPSGDNGLRMRSFVMVDKIQTIRREKAGAVFGAIGGEAMGEIDRLLPVVIGLAR